LLDNGPGFINFCFEALANTSVMAVVSQLLLSMLKMQSRTSDISIIWLKHWEQAVVQSLISAEHDIRSRIMDTLLLPVVNLYPPACDRLISAVERCEINSSNNLMVSLALLRLAKGSIQVQSEKKYEILKV
jgi:hypothetical protein